MTDPRDKQRQRDRHLRGSHHHRSREEEQQLADARKSHPKAPRSRRRAVADDDEAGIEKIQRRERVLDAGAKKAKMLANSAQSTGTITWLTRGRALVRCEDQEREARLSPELASTQQTSLAVGDEVMLWEQGDGDPVVVEVHERKSQLVRRDPGNEHRHRVLAANVDLVVLVLAADRTRTGLIDRLLVALNDSGAELAVCINKCDLPFDREELERALRPHSQSGLPIAIVSATRGDQLEELEALVRTRTVAFVGHSGVGKSTLLNCLDPAAEERATSAVRQHDGKGRHTTTASRLTVLADGTRLIDTPGVRAFGLTDGQTDARAAFEDVLAFADGCRFRDCAHRAEPGCAVRAAVDEGHLDAARHEAFLSLTAK